MAGGSLALTMHTPSLQGEWRLRDERPDGDSTDLRFLNMGRSCIYEGNWLQYAAQYPNGIESRDPVTGKAHFTLYSSDRLVRKVEKERVLDYDTPGRERQPAACFHRCRVSEGRAGAPTWLRVGASPGVCRPGGV